MSGREVVPEITKELISNYAREIFGNPRKASSWMETPNNALRGMRPKDFIEYANAEDMQLAYEELQRIDQGVF